MCGIDGIISRLPLDAEQIARQERMNAALAHRGPDGEGKYHTAHVALGMRRLSIIDVGGSWQPLYNEDRSLAIIANGEIYNYIELRRALIARGHTLQTDGDIETILHLYEDFGIDCVHHLRGMVAFALYDAHLKRVLIVRDRMGEKPLYYARHDERVIFASEMKALLAGLPFTPALDPQAIDLYFHFGYVPEPHTPLQGVRKLPAGHLLMVDLDPWRVEERQYWDMADAPPLEGDPIEAIRAELDTVSTLVIRSDVPVGVALSGGLDSSALAALTVSKYPGTLHAFSVGYPGHPPNDERRDAQQLADHLGIPFHDIEIVTDELVAFFPALVRAADDPIADPAAYGYYMVSRLARQQGVPVLLQGQGGDELFWGYPWVRHAAEEALLKQRLYTDALIPSGMPSAGRGWRASVKKLLGRPESTPEAQQMQRVADGYPNTPPFIDLAPDFQIAEAELSTLYPAQWARQITARNAYAPFTVAAPWPDVPVMMTRLISQTYLQENGIAQGDRLSMASSVELRLPLVDYRLVEVVIGHRKTQPDHTQPPKAWLRGALAGIVPEWVMNRPKKGFAPPILEWYSRLLSAYGTQLPGGYLVSGGVLRPAAAARLAAGDSLNAGVITLPFKALTLELWCRQMLG